MIAGRLRTSVFGLGTELSLQPRVIERLLPVHLSGWGRVGAATIITTEEFVRLRDLLRQELETAVVQTPEFCRRNEIDTDLFRTLLPPRDEIGQDGNFVWENQLWREKKATAQTALEGAISPVEIAGILPDVPVAGKIVAELVKEGAVKGSTELGRFVPAAYVQQRHDALVAELQRNGVLAVEALRKERITNPAEFIGSRVPTARLLDSHFITPVYIAHISSYLLSRIESSSWTELTDPEQRLTPTDFKLLRPTILAELPELCLTADRLVPATLSATLSAQAEAFARSQADVAYRSSSSSPSSFKGQDLQKHFLRTINLHSALATHFATTLGSTAVSAFAVRLQELRTADVAAATTSFVDRFYARFLVNLRALDSLSDVSLRSKLAADLLEHARTAGAAAVDKLAAVLDDCGPSDDDEAAALETELAGMKTVLAEAKDAKKALPALQGLNTHFAFLAGGGGSAPAIVEEVFQRRKMAMLDEFAAQLRATPDPSLMLLLALVLTHARASGGGDEGGGGGGGVLRATGKYVPKLLKELKTMGKLGEAQAVQLAEVKELVVKGAPVDEESRAAVRRIGLGEDEGEGRPKSGEGVEHTKESGATEE